MHANAFFNASIGEGCCCCVMSSPGTLSPFSCEGTARRAKSWAACPMPAPLGTQIFYRLQNERVVALCRAVCTQVAAEMDGEDSIPAAERMSRAVLH